MTGRLRFLPMLLWLVVGWLAWHGFEQPAHLASANVIGQALHEVTLVAWPQQQKMSAKWPKGPFILHVWATWCHVCGAEWPSLSQHQALPWVGVVYHDGVPAVQQWLSLRGNPLQQIWFDPDDDLAYALGVTGTPETFLVSADRHIVAHWDGAMTATDWQQLDAKVAELHQAEEY